MRMIEAVVRRCDFRGFCECAERLGIFGFDLSEHPADKCRCENPSSLSKLTVRFAVLDSEATDTVHEVLEQAHPDSIGTFRLDQEPLAQRPNGIRPVKTSLS